MKQVARTKWGVYKGNEEMEIISSNHVSVEEVEENKEVPQLEDAQEAPTSFKKGN